LFGAKLVFQLLSQLILNVIFDPDTDVPEILTLFALAVNKQLNNIAKTTATLLSDLFVFMIYFFDEFKYIVKDEMKLHLSKCI
jgi:hypothetical protein